ncbi:hypothetical protein MKX01_040099 [Papaver californicum]|nr:hypothetical protein MKX01_040099 [Papaver californicum]
MERRVGIIGAGISGLLACKYVLEKGFQPIVFESQPGLGGVWTHTVETTKLQSPKQAFVFSDFPWSTSYLESYALHFGLLPYIKFNTKVINIDYLVQEGQDMLSWSHWGGTDQAISNPKVPNILNFPPNKGPDAYTKGKVMHSMDYSAMDDADAAKFVKGKRVTIVGLQKLALDIASECAIANGVENPCTLVYRTGHWNVPDYRPWGPGVSLLLHSILIVSLSLCFINLLYQSKFPLKKYNMVPDNSFSQEISSCLLAMKSKGFSFYKNVLIFDDDVGATLETDAVILATGYKIWILCVQRMYSSAISQLAINGFSESLVNLYTSEMRLPGIIEMEKDVLKWEKYMKCYCGQYYRRSCIGAVHIWYNNQLCKDIGFNPKRKNGFYAELFERYGTMDYANLTHSKD